MTDAERLAFIETSAKLHRKYADMFGFHIISAAIAQSCLESTYGTSNKVVKGNDYRGNYHGMKWKAEQPNRCPSAIGHFAEWSGEQNPDGTYSGGLFDWWRFPSHEMAVKGYYEFLTNSKWADYSAAKTAKSAEEYLTILKNQGYASSLDYVKNVMAVVKKWNLEQYDNATPAPAPVPTPTKAVKIMLDAGHYGKYNRSPVVPEYYESDFTWKLQGYLKAELESRGFIVGVTRTNKDKDLGLTDRGNMAKGYDLFISLHSNAAGTESVDRVEGIYQYNNARSKEVAYLLAPLVKSVMGTKDAPKEYYKLSANDRNGDGVLNDEYYGVLHGARMVGVAGVIIEHGFHTNTAGAKWLLQDANVRKLAVAEANTLAEYFHMDGSTPAVQVNPYPVPNRTVKYQSPTMAGEDVKWVQWELNFAGASLDVDGRCGAKTDKAIREYQKTHKSVNGKPLEVDGKVGYNTRMSLLANH